MTNKNDVTDIISLLLKATAQMNDEIVIQNGDRLNPQLHALVIGRLKITHFVNSNNQSTYIPVWLR